MKGYRGIARSVLLLLFPLLVGISGCELERRNGIDTELVPDSLLVGDTIEGEDRPAPPESTDPAESVRITMEVFREAVRVGDLSVALQLLDSRALLLDDLAGENGIAGGEASTTTRGELLLELRRKHMEGLHFDVTDDHLAWLDDTAVLTSHLVLIAREADLDTPPDTVSVMRETAVLRPTPEGWRIVHLHRSLAPEGVER